MAGAAEGPIGERELGDRVAFDAVLTGAKAQENARLRRYRQRWIAQQVAILVVVLVVLALTVPLLVGTEDAVGSLPALVVFFTGGWLGYLVLMAVVAGAGLASVLAIGRFVGVLRTDDLASYEQAHEPWWAERSR